MWQQTSDTTTRGNVADNEKNYKDSSNRQDSGIVDSGFISSGGNLLTSSEFSGDEDNTDEIGPTPSGFNQDGRDSGNIVDEAFAKDPGCNVSDPIGAVSEDSMRADSGFDLGLTESLSQLSIAHKHINRLGGYKVQSEPVIELRPINVKADVVKNRRNAQQQLQQQQLQQHQQHQEQNAILLQQYCQEPWKLYYTQDDDGDTQLHIAIVQGFLEATFSLIRMAPHPCLLNILNDDCQAPLHLAVLTRQPRITRRLILAGANPSLRDFRGNTALHLACASGDVGCAKALTDPLSNVERNFLANGKRIPALPQNLEQRNYDGEMCLHVAASGDQVDLVQHLLRLGADLEAREALSGRTALHIALERGCHGVVNFILRECRPSLDATTYAGITAYQIAICLDGQLARELVRLGAKPEPIPETDSEMSDDDIDVDASYMPALARLRQGVGLRA